MLWNVAGKLRRSTRVCPVVRIDIWSDVVCPWCYLGNHRLQSALDTVGRDDIEIRWRAFQLDPNAPLEAGELRSRLESKYGPGSFDSMTRRLTDLGRAEGLEYRFDKALSPNTRDAHRLIAWAYDAGGSEAQNALVERLFQGYFTNGEDYSRSEVLLDAVADVNLDRSAAQQVLDDGSYGEQVAEDQREAQEAGISGVPAFVIDGHWLIPGAQETERFVAMLEKVRAGAESPSSHT